MHPLDDGLSIRRASREDLDIVLHHRREMFREMGSDPSALAAMDATSEPHFARGLEDGTYHGWLVVTGAHEVVAGGGITLVPFHPSPRDPESLRAWIVNVYTEHAYRRRGLARKLMLVMVEWCREQGYHTVYLHASSEGRPLYEAMEFHPTSEMRLTLRPSV